MKELLRDGLKGRDFLVLYEDGYKHGGKSLGGDCFSASLVKNVYRKNASVTYDFYFPMNTVRVYDCCPLMCPLSFEEINDYLNDINLILEEPIQWEIKDVSEEFSYGNEVTKVSVTITTNYNYRKHLYILTRVRQMVEIPFCFLIKDAIRLKKEFPDKFDSIEHAFYQTLFLGYETYVKSNNDGGIFSYYDPIFNSNRCSIRVRHRNRETTLVNLTWDGIDCYKKRFKALSVFEEFQNRLFPEEDYRTAKDLGFDPLSFSIKTKNIYDLEYWLTGFERRLPIYLREKSDDEYVEYQGSFTLKDPGMALANFRQVLRSKIQ